MQTQGRPNHLSSISQGFPSVRLWLTEASQQVINRAVFGGSERGDSTVDSNNYTKPGVIESEFANVGA